MCKIIFHRISVGVQSCNPFEVIQMGFVNKLCSIRMLCFQQPRKWVTELGSSYLLWALSKTCCTTFAVMSINVQWLNRRWKSFPHSPETSANIHWNTRSTIIPLWYCANASSVTSQSWMPATTSNKRVKNNKQTKHLNLNCSKENWMSLSLRGYCTPDQI